MYNYRLLNSSGTMLGVVSLETEDLFHLLVAGEKVVLSAEANFARPYTETGIDFVVTPEPVKAKLD